MRKTLLAFSALTILSYGVYRMACDRRVRDLFAPGRPLPKQEEPAVPAAKGAGHRPAPSPGEPAKRAERRRVLRRDLPVPEAPPANQTPNEVVRRVLLQILRARNLADGITLGANDKTVLVSGTVDTEEERRQILEILEKAREARSIDASELVVRP